MKEKNFLEFITFLLFALLVFTNSTSAHRLLSHKQGEKKVEAKGIIQPASLLTDNTKQEFSNLMGSEDCNEKDEECLKIRRMIAEAHLDYIYTQHHKP